MYMYTCVYVNMRIYACVCIYVLCICVCIYIYIYTYLCRPPALPGMACYPYLYCSSSVFYV